MDTLTAVADETRDSSTENDPRAGWFADVRAVLDVAQAHPELPRPGTREDAVEFFLLGTVGGGGQAPRILASAEAVLSAALGVTFAGRAGDQDNAGERCYYLLEATLPGGTTLRVKAWNTAVAEKRVTGQRVVEDVEWVRLPVPPGEPARDGQAAGNEVAA